MSETDAILMRGEEKNTNELCPLELRGTYRCSSHNVHLALLSDTVEDAKGTEFTRKALD